MVIAPASTPAAAHRDDDGAAEIAARVASGPGFWTEWLAELDRQGLLEELLAEDVIARALREAPPGHKYDRVLTAKMTVACVLVACLFPGAGYDAVLATAFGLPGLRSVPGAEIPSGSAFSQARKLLGEQVMQRLFELDAAVADADLGIGLLWKGLEVTAIDGTTMELARNGVLDGDRVRAGQVLGTVVGPLASVLTGERTALNFLCHLSGVATLTRRFTDAAIAGNPNTRVWDTRKTLPGLRLAQKYAVRAGGGCNHRMGLHDAVMLKENHIHAAGCAHSLSPCPRWSSARTTARKP